MTRFIREKLNSNLVERSLVISYYYRLGKTTITQLWGCVFVFALEINNGLSSY